MACLLVGVALIDRPPMDGTYSIVPRDSPDCVLVLMKAEITIDYLILFIYISSACQNIVTERPNAPRIFSDKGRGATSDGPFR